MSITRKYKSLINKYGLMQGIIIFNIKIVHKINWYIVDLLVRLLFNVKQNRILFETGSDYSDNGRALFEYLIKEKYNNIYEIIWLVSDPEKYSEINIKNVSFIRKTGKLHGNYTLKSLFYGRTSKILFFTHSNVWLKKKREKQQVINLWHGCGYKDTKAKRNDFFDYCLIPGELFIETKSKFFSQPKEKFLPIGYPRYDWFKSNKNLKGKFDFMNNNSDSYTNIVWMPTFRKSEIVEFSDDTLVSETGLPIVSSIKKLGTLNQYCLENKINLIIKAHRMELSLSNKFKNTSYSNLYLLTDEILEDNNTQLYELIPHFDGLITDYSSIAIDFLLLDKQIGFTLDDYEMYKNIRGFVFEDPREYMPGKHIYHYEDLIMFLENVKHGVDNYKIDRAKVRQIAHSNVKNYSEEIVRLLNL